MLDRLSGLSSRLVDVELRSSSSSILVCSLSLFFDKADESGFNDKGESIPFQGGTNEEVVDRLYKKLSKEKKEQYLKVYW